MRENVAFLQDERDGGTAARRARVTEFYLARNREIAPFEGQRSPEFQRDLVAFHSFVTPADCDFYHTLEMPDGAVLRGEWDLRGHEDLYVGQVPLRNRSVLEFGPASGAISAYIASQGARLTVFDLPLGGAPEMVPMDGVDVDGHRRNATASYNRLRCSWWYARARLGFDATAIYGDIYRLPADIGRHDVSVFGAILLHLSNPFAALRSAAAITDDTIVVTDVFTAPSFAGLADVQSRTPSLVVFNPTPPPVGLTHWWALSPDLIGHMLRLLGFADQTVTTHTPANMAEKPPMFTVVARKGRPATKNATRPELGTAGDQLAVPPPGLRYLVAGTEDEDIFLRLGLKGFQALTASLRRCGIEPSGLGRVLDFGCGVGRVTRHWVNLPGVEVHGTDLSDDMIRWDREHLGFGVFETNAVHPGLPYSDGMFDLVYALSVFTHLPEELQARWWRELVRVVRPGGCLYMTTHGDRYVDLLTTSDADAFRASRLVVTGGEQPGSNHCAAFHPRRWIEDNFIVPLGLEVLEHVPCGALGNPEQDSFLVRKPAA